MQTLRVLIVDDHEGFRNQLANFLERQKGIQVVATAKDGIEAISLTETLSPDVVCMDIAMPGMDGLSASRYIKSHWPKTKIVIVTVHEEGEYKSAAEAIGADGFVRKSCLDQDLQKILRSKRITSSLRSPASKR